MLLVAGVRYLQQAQLETVLVRQGLQHLVGFLAVGRTVKERDDLLALEPLLAACLLSDPVDDGRYLGIGIELQREDVREYAAVGGIGTPVVDGDQRQLVGRGALQGGIRDTHRQRIGGGSRCAVEPTLEALVALHPLLHDVFSLALAPGQLDAIHAALGVDVLEVIDKTTEETGTTCGIGANAVALQGEILFVGRVHVECAGS